MIYDADNLPDNKVLRPNVCIIGAGPAGMAIAMSLAKNGKSVCMLEAGGLQPEKKSVELAKVHNVGDPCFDPSIRRAFAFGGTTWMWSGWCRPFDPVDYEARPWVPNSGWPISYSEVAQYYDRASQFLQNTESTFDLKSLSRDGELVSHAISGGIIETRLFNVLKPPALGHLYLKEFEEADAIEVYYHAYVKHIRPSPDGDRIDSVEFCDSGGRMLQMRADTFILAAGAIDNARLMLATERSHVDSGFKFSEALGRYFMLRIHAGGGFIRRIKDEALSLKLYNHSRRGVVGRFFVSPEAQRAYRLMRYNISFHPVTPEREAWLLPLTLGAGTVSRRTFLAALTAGGLYMTVRQSGILGGSAHPPFRLNHTVEQAPYANSRISLSDHEDRFGSPMANVEWRTTDLDKRSMYESARLMAKQLNRWGKVSINLDGFAGIRSPWPPDEEQGVPGHYMGTTRMGTNRQTSVVDPNCRVHGMKNMYIAGSSVFPTSGNGTPTLTIVALALRLADYLADSN